MWESNVQNVRRKHPGSRAQPPLVWAPCPARVGEGLRLREREGGGQTPSCPAGPTGFSAGAGAGSLASPRWGEAVGQQLAPAALVPCVSSSASLPRSDRDANSNLNESLLFKAPDPSRGRGRRRGGAGQRCKQTALLSSSPLQAALAIPVVA